MRRLGRVQGGIDAALRGFLNGMIPYLGHWRWRRDFKWGVVEIFL